MTIRITNLREFNREIKAFGHNTVPKNHVALQKRIALDLLRRIIFRTPVDTGRARGNWQVTLGPADEKSLVTTDPGGAGTLARGAATIAGAQPFGLITVYNNVNYINRLEGGHSQQAPSGMVRLSLTEVEGQFA